MPLRILMVEVFGVILKRSIKDAITRANISHDEAEQIRARIVCTPAESARRA